MSDGSTGRSREATEAMLLDATATLLAERGPGSVSVRDIAEQAGVNKGLVHHYFGGKRGLIEAAVRALAQEHFANATERAGGGPLPVPLTLSLDERYWQVIVRLVLEGELELAGIEFDDDISVPRRAFDTLAADAPDDTTIKGAVAAAMALELGWAAFKPFVMQAVRADDGDVHAIENSLREALRGLTSETG